MLIETRGSLVFVVVVVVESVNKGVDYATVIWGCEIPMEKLGRGAIVIGVVIAVGDGEV